jgi:ankyrin repeat protein
LPEDLNETYERMLCNIPKAARNSATRLFHFLVYCDRPVTVPEAIEIIATDTEAEPPSFDVDGRVFGDDDVLRHGPSLLSIIEMTKYDGEIRKELHLAHFSVKEFLQSRADFQQPKASIIITKTSLTYLTDITGANKDIKRNFPMARLAAEIWTKHGAPAENCEDSFRGIVKFLEDRNTFQRWGRLYQPDQAWMKDPGRPRGSRLYYACLSGLVGVARELVEKGADVNAQGGTYGNALQAASEGGHFDIVKLLLEKGADVNAQGGFYGNALQAASSRGHVQTVMLLLREGADANAQGGTYGNALQAASSRGYGEIVKLLLDKGADVNVGRFGNALEAASFGGHVEIVKLLVEKGADVNAQGGRFGNALEAASSRGYGEIVKLLLDKGADVNGGRFGNALYAASFQDHVKIVQLLLDKGADVNAQGGRFGNALRAASSRGHIEIVKLLVDKRVDDNAQG